MQVRRYLPVLILISIACSSQPTLSAPNYTLDHITTRDGLPQSSVKAIAQDHQGFLWIGTELGLARYDGYRFVRFSPPFGRSIVMNINVDSKGRIWVAWYNKPVTILDPTNGSWRVLEVSGALSAGQAFLEATDGTIWLSDTSSLYYYDEARKTAVVAADLDYDLTIGSVPDMAILNGILWTNVGDGVLGYDVVQREVVARFDYELLESRLPHGYRGFWVHDGAVWLCGQTAVYRIDGLSRPRTVYDNQDEVVVSCAHDTDGSLWIGTNGSGVLRIDASGKSERFVHDPDDDRSIARNVANSIQQDSQGNTWLITYGTANLFRAGAFERFEFGPDINESFGGGFAAIHLFEDNSGALWFGSEGSGLARISRYRQKFRFLVPPSKISRHIRRPAIDAHGDIWIGTQKDGVYNLSREHGSWSHFGAQAENPKQLPTTDVRELLVTSNNDIWAGSSLDIISRFNPESADWSRYSLGGRIGIFDLHELNDGRIAVGRVDELTILDPATGRAERHSLEGQSTIRAIAQSKKGSIYLGMHGGASVREFMPGKGFLNSWSAGLDDASVFSLYEDRFGYLWVGTWNEGLFRLNPTTGESQSINTKTGLPDDTIFGILPGVDDNLWVSMYSGLARIENCIVDSLSCKPQISVFDASDGLLVTEFDSEAYFSAPDGELFFGGGEGMVHFHPNDIEFNAVAPTLRMVATQLNDTRVQLRPTGEEIVLENSYGALSLEFSALDYHNPANNQYRYRLNPELAWISLGNTPGLTMNNLGTGRYTVQISGSNNDGVWSKTPLTFKARVLPPLYLSNAAIGTYALLLVTSIFVFVRARESKLRANKAALESMVASRTRELNDANMARDEFYANVSHEVRTPLTLLLNSVERLESGDTGDKEETAIEAIRRHSESLHRYIDSLITVSHLSSSADIEWFAEDLLLFLRGLVRDIKAIAGHTEISFPALERDDVLVRSYPNALSTIFSNLLVNAVKHTPAGGEIAVEVEESDEWVTVTIADSGPGIDDDELFSIFDRGARGSARIRNIVGFGIGLNLVKQTVQALGGQVSVRNNPDQGACFEVRLVAADSTLPISSYESNGHLGLLGEWPEQSSSEGSESSSRGSLPLVLVVEDHDELRSEICEQLESEYEVIQAGDATTALELAEIHLPDLIICDVMLPDKDGFEVVRQIKTNAVTDHIAVMLLTALADEESRLSGLALRADAYLTKPYRHDELKLTIRNLLVGRRTMMRYSAMKAWQEETAGVDQITNPAKSFEHRFMAALQSVYADNESGVVEIAGLVAMSRRQLERKTRSCFEQSPSALLSEYRLSKAAALLLDSFAVGEAAYRCGFGNQSHFATVFRKRFGTTPAAYKKQQTDPDE